MVMLISSRMDVVIIAAKLVRHLCCVFELVSPIQQRCDLHRWCSHVQSRPPPSIAASTELGFIEAVICEYNDPHLHHSNQYEYHMVYVGVSTPSSHVRMRPSLFFKISVPPFCPPDIARH